MSAGAGSAAVRVDREHVGGATEGADGHPATVLGETHILDLGRQRMKKIASDDHVPDFRE